MSPAVSANRRGEWLELMPGKLKTAEGEERLSAALAWLETSLGAPSKLIRKLQAEDGIKLAGDRLRLRIFPPRVSQYTPYWHELTVLYEDEFCLVVHKPAGVKVHPDGAGQEATLVNMVAALYAERGEQAAPGHIHRLDEYTSGPVLFAKNEYAQLKLDEAMSRKSIGRTYIAFVHGIVSRDLKVIDKPIGRDRHHSQRRRVSPTGKPAITRVELLETYPAASLVRLTLETGRTHQIRVHLADAGHPLIGDKLYGGKTDELPFQALHGERLIFPHPLMGDDIQVDDPTPPVWDRLKKRLAGLS
ncbi:RluA family pseudouridine synthase [Paenibacillus puldeungensis]